MRAQPASKTHRRALSAAIFAAIGAAALAHADAPRAPAQPASTITVTNCDDDGSGSLRWALGLATDGDTIDLAQLTCSTITLTSGQLVNSHTISLTGPGADQLTIDGHAADRVLLSYSALAISDLTIANGRRADGLGGCLAANADVDLTRVVVSGCVAGDGSTSNTIGGGVLVDGGATLNLVSSRVTGNTARGASSAYGGGIAVIGNGSGFTSTDSRIDDNHAEAGTQMAFGGGFLVAGTSTTTVLQDTVVEDNHATSTSNNATAGGGAVLDSSSVVIGHFSLHGGRVSGNVAEGMAGAGGGLVIADAEAVLDSGASCPPTSRARTRRSLTARPPRSAAGWCS